MTELGGEPVRLGIVADDWEQLRRRVIEALSACDAVLLSGGTSKGAGDISYRVVGELGQVCAHGVAIKPGKPTCLASAEGKPLVVLPGFPTSATFTFHEFVAPVLREMAGRSAEEDRGVVRAELAGKLRSVLGRREYVLVSLTRSATDPDAPPAAFPLGKGSGSVTMFGHADGFVAVDMHTELLEPQTLVDVRLMGRSIALSDLTVVGSHCVGLDWIVAQLAHRGLSVKSLHIGSLGGLDAVRRGRCDVAGIHLLDEATGAYNVPFLERDLMLIPGYERRQGIVFRSDDDRFAGRGREEIIERIRSDRAGRMVHRNRGSGTRILIDRLLDGRRPDGSAHQPRTHHAVAVAVRQGRADWGVTIEPVARMYELGFVELQPESYDFVVRRDHRSHEGVCRFVELLEAESTREVLRSMGFDPRSEVT